MTGLPRRASHEVINLETEVEAGSASGRDGHPRAQAISPAPDPSQLTDSANSDESGNRFYWHVPLQTSGQLTT